MTNYVYLVDKYGRIVKQAIVNNENDMALRSMAHHMAPKGRCWEVIPVIDTSTLEFQIANFVVSDQCVLINSPCKLRQEEFDRIVDRARFRYWMSRNKRRD